MGHYESRDAKSNVSSTWPRRISWRFSRLFGIGKIGLYLGGIETRTDEKRTYSRYARSSFASAFQLVKTLNITFVLLGMARAFIS